MRNVSLPCAAAWAPWPSSGHDNWAHVRDEVAADWLTRAAATDGDRIIVQAMAYAHDFQRGDDAVARLARQGAVATYKSPVGNGAVLVPRADIKLLATAMIAADGRPVVATETSVFPIHGWAMATGAVNLATNEVTPDERTPEQVKLLEHLVDQLYNGWAHKQVARRASAHVMPRLADSGMTYPVFVGSLLAMDPYHLDSNTDINEMNRALPPAWERERQKLSGSWAHSL